MGIIFRNEATSSKVCDLHFILATSEERNIKLTLGWFELKMWWAGEKNNMKVFCTKY